MAHSEPPTADAGRALFEAGCTIASAQRFRDMQYPPHRDAQEEYERAELRAYFDWEANSLILYVYEKMVERLPGEVRHHDCFRGGFYVVLPDGRDKCVNCGDVRRNG